MKEFTKNLLKFASIIAILFIVLFILMGVMMK